MHSEGGHGMVWNRQGSGAFGPFQFMRGTFYAYVRPAFARAWVEGQQIPVAYARWNSYLGQSFTAAHMFARGLSWHWTGRGC